MLYAIVTDTVGRVLRNVPLDGDGEEVIPALVNVVLEVGCTRLAEVDPRDIEDVLDAKWHECWADYETYHGDPTDPESDPARWFVITIADKRIGLTRVGQTFAELVAS